MLESLNWIERILIHSEQQDVCCFLTSNGFEDKYGEFEWIYGVGVRQVFHSPDEMQGFNGWALGHISYQFVNREFKSLYYTKNEKNRWEDFDFFEPKQIIWLRKGASQVQGDVNLIQELDSISENSLIGNGINGKLSNSPSTNQEKYLETVELIKDKIESGVFYEMNYCIENTYFSEVSNLAGLFYYLNQSAPSPFAAYYKRYDSVLMCASPERFLKKNGEKLVSQPIKGTLKRRGGRDAEERSVLRKNEKDQAENIMIVDLVRNDLSKVSKIGSVLVKELCEIYTFSHVHQMISTIESTLKEGVNIAEIIDALFPMGSMTGAPKIEVMKYIQQLEDFNREVYSGTLGYYYNGDFDLNVVIRSIEYNIKEKKLRNAVGGAITYDSNALNEWEECLSKSAAIKKILDP